jgi:ubiquinone/menaquinone biosynthesis C-methylase UbiE
MRDPLGINERLFALYYPRLLELAERAGQRETRRELISHARGRVLEVGAGSGVNLPHYTPEVEELVISEPSPHMLDHLRRALQEQPPPVGGWRLVQAGGEELPFGDGSFDTVVATYVLCTIPDPVRAVAEIRRVLKQGGRYLFLEHVHAGEGTLLGAAQDVLELPHRYIAAGCHPNRRTGRVIAGTDGLQLERMERGRQPRAPFTVRPTIIGSALRA